MIHDHQHDQSQPASGPICPVTHVPVDVSTAEHEGLVRVYKGQKYYFCCNLCPPQFDADPERYTAA